MTKSSLRHKLEQEHLVESHGLGPSWLGSGVPLGQLCHAPAMLAIKVVKEI